MEKHAFKNTTINVQMFYRVYILPTTRKMSSKYTRIPCPSVPARCKIFFYSKTFTQGTLRGLDTDIFFLYLTLNM